MSPHSGSPICVHSTGLFPLIPVVLTAAAMTLTCLFLPISPKAVDAPVRQVFAEPTQTDSEASLGEPELTPRPVRMKVGACLVDIKADSAQGCNMTISEEGSQKIVLQRHFDHNVQFLTREVSETEYERGEAEELSLTPGDKCGGPLKNTRLAFGLYEEGSGRYFVYSVKPDVRELFSMDKISSMAIARVGGRDEFFVAERYADWGAVEVAPRMVLYWDDTLNKLRLDRAITPDLSRLRLLDEQYKDLPALDDEDIMAMAPPELAEQTLNILYCGQYKQARDFFNRNWPPQRRGRLAYWKMLIGKAKSSNLWQYVEAVTN